MLGSKKKIFWQWVPTAKQLPSGENSITSIHPLWPAAGSIFQDYFTKESKSSLLYLTDNSPSFVAITTWPFYLLIATHLEH